MDVPIHCCFDAGMTQQFLQHLGLYAAFDRSRGISMAQSVHTEFFNSYFVPQREKSLLQRHNYSR